jgi:hypothetical protein
VLHVCELLNTLCHDILVYVVFKLFLCALRRRPSNHWTISDSVFALLRGAKFLI